MNDVQRVQAAILLIRQELNRAIAKFPPMQSAHEGYAILVEEVEELWHEVKQSQKFNNQFELRDEAVQVAAMSIRFLIDICYLELED